MAKSQLNFVIGLLNNNEQLIFVYLGKASQLNSIGRYDEALALLKKCDSLYEITDFPGKKRSIGFNHYHLACSYYGTKKYDLSFINIVAV